MMNDPRVSHDPLLATRTLSWPYRLSAYTFGQHASSVLSSLSLFAPFHHDIPSPLASLDLVIEQPHSGGFRSLPLSPASTFVLFLVYFSHPRTVEMQFASELLLLPPSQPVAASNNQRRLTTAGNYLSRRKKILENSIEIANVNTNCPIIRNKAKEKKNRQHSPHI